MAALAREGSPETRTSRRHESSGWKLLVFVLVVSGFGLVAILQAFRSLVSETLAYQLPLLALATIFASRFEIRLPGQAASVNVSDVFIFAAILSLGPAQATAIVVVDGLLRAFMDRSQPLHRAPLNVAEPAVSTWTAGQVYLIALELTPQITTYSAALVWLPVAAMAATYFTLQSSVMALTQGLESGLRPTIVWRRYALLLAVKHYTATALAVLAGATGQTFNPVALAMLAPLLGLSYVAYREASARVEAAHRHVSDVERLYKATVETLAVAVDAKDQVTHGHIRRVQRHAIAVARALGVTDPIAFKALESAALLHDVGKLAMPDYVLNKPGSLTLSEFETIKRHATKGATILTAVEFPYPVVPIVRHHHEWWNGRGYPDGLAGEDIPLGARILAVVDCFDALTSDRPYRRHLKDDEAVQMLRERSGTVYDPRIVEEFIGLIPDLRKEDEKVDGRISRVVPVPTEAALAVDPIAELVSTTRGEAVMRTKEAGRNTIEKLIKVFPRAEACLFTVNETGDSILRAIATPLIEGAIADLPYPVGQGLSGWVAANRHSIVNSDPGLDLGDQAALLGLHSAAATPVFAFGTVVAVLTVYMPERGAFSERQARIIGVLAQEIGNELVHLEALQLRAPLAARAALPLNSIVKAPNGPGRPA